MERDSSRPPTLNFLGPFQRSRLLKSSRKIEYILGTTPHVLESSDFHHHHLVQDGHTTTPDRRFKSKKRQDQGSTRLHLSPVSPPTDDSSPSGLPSPIPLTVSIPHPSARLRTLAELPDHHHQDSPDRLHRKQMAKLTRVLGENIPPELVRNAHSGDSITRRPRRGDKTRRSSSYSPLPDHLPGPVASSSSAPSPHLAFSTSPSPPPPPSFPANFSRRLDAQSGNERRSPGPGSPSPTSLEESSSGSGRSAHPLLTSDQRVEARWNGEWNVKDTERRAVALRNLKRR